MNIIHQEQIIFQISALKRGNVMSRWKRRCLLLYKDSLIITKTKNNDNNNKHSKNVYLPLTMLKVIEDKKTKQFMLQCGKKKIHFKVDKDNEQSKQMFIELLNKTINECIITRKNMEDITQHKDNTDDSVVDINKSDYNKICWYLDKVCNYMLILQDMQRGVKKSIRDSFGEIIMLVMKDVNNVKSLLNVTHKVVNDNNNKQINLQNEKVNVHTLQHDVNCNNKESVDVLNKVNNKKDNNSSSDSNIEQNDSSSNSQSFSDDGDNNNNNKHPSAHDIKSVREILNESQHNLHSFNHNLSYNTSDFLDNNYTYPPRKTIPLSLKLSENFLKDSIKCATRKNTPFPITYNEPISMLQKQCEKFFNITYLHNASSPSITQPQRILYITSFILGELSLNINRLLKPFNPILSETYEYFDNTNKYRFFSEQVSHTPPISAYICETEDFVYYGDTRCKTAFRFIKCGMEIEFTNKTYIYFKNINEKYTFNKPKINISGVINGLPKYECEGKVVIELVSNKKLKAELKVMNTHVDGVVVNDGNVLFKINGDVKEGVNVVDKDGENKRELFVVEERKHFMNGFDKYDVPLFTLNLNYVDDNIKKCLPLTDSRNRPDQREYENGNIDKAIELRKVIEQKQRLRHKQFEEDKVIYEPVYFKNVFDEESEDYVYVYNGNYFEERKNGTFIKNEDIFGLNDKDTNDTK